MTTPTISLILFWFFWLFVLGAMFGAMFGSWLKEKQLKKKILSAENIIACFKDVDWGIQTFKSGETFIETPDGIKHFYKVPSIDVAIKKLNKLVVSSD
jgi:hypothetical protein